MPNFPNSVIGTSDPVTFRVVLFIIRLFDRDPVVEGVHGAVGEAVGLSGEVKGVERYVEVEWQDGGRWEVDVWEKKMAFGGNLSMGKFHIGDPGFLGEVRDLVWGSV
jgi:hypothetical protein